MVELGSGFKKVLLLLLFFKYCADVENCGSFKSFGFIYILVIGPCVARFYEKTYKINV